MSKGKVIQAVDLFCGAGGTTTGLKRACESMGRRLDLLAINHWDIAIETHAANHPELRHLCASVDNLDPWRAVPSGRLDLLVASPECTHFSVARGGRPACDQSRASAWHILRWAESLHIDNILIENVPEFQTWGPLGANGQPLKSRKGETFKAFVAALESLNYRVESRVLNAADYGDATTRRRLFVLARRGRKRITWPIRSHSPAGEATLFGETKSWRPAREIIDWSLLGGSIFTRKRPLKPRTLARIEAGLRKFGGDAAEPFLVILRGTSSTRSVGRPLPTLTAGGGHLGLIQPYIIPQHSGGAPRSTENPLPTICTTARGIALVQPFLVPFFGERNGQEPRTHSVDEPVPAVTSHGAGGLVQPFLVKYNGNGTPEPVDRPLSTVTTRDRFGLVQPAQLDILFRMLQPHELAAAMGLEGYEFKGNKSETVKQIGNAVATGVAQALSDSLLREAA